MELVLTADPTRPKGTRPSRRLRREGRIPAVVYGMGSEPTPISVPWRDLRQCLKTEAGINAVITLDIDGTRMMSLVKEIQRHPVRRDVIHVDFMRVDPKKPVIIEVPVVVTGEAKKVANMQGIVDQQMFKIQISALPDAIPNEILVDVSDLDIGDVITVADLPLEAGSTAISEPGATVVQGGATRSTIQLRSEATKTAEDAAAEGGEGGETGDDDAAGDDTADAADAGE
jgi:large subunit ribosomal protein L25